MRQAGEPSVEEILDAIKKVIARDNRDGAAELRRTRELTVAARETDEVLDLGTIGEYLDDDETDQLDGYDLDGAEAPDGPLVAKQTVNSISDSLAALAMLAQPSAPPQIVRSGETSLEGMARELLRPALAEWLDKNLPALVEKLVASEIARIVGKKG